MSKLEENQKRDSYGYKFLQLVVFADCKAVRGCQIIITKTKQ